MGHFKWDTGGPEFLDEDNMASDDAEAVASQQSIKAYVYGLTYPLLDEDDMASDSAISAASQQSIKAYIDTRHPANYIDLPDTTSPATPPSGKGRVYVNGDGLLFKDDNGLVYPIAGSWNEFKSITAPSTPASGRGIVYMNSDRLFYKDANGVVTTLSFIGCSAVETTVSNYFTNSTWWVIPFGYGERYDIGGCHSTSTNSHRFYAPIAGYYMLTASFGFGTNTIGDRLAILYDNNINALAYISHIAAYYDPTRIHISGMGYLAANGFFYVQGFQNSGSTLSLVDGWAQFTRIA